MADSLETKPDQQANSASTTLEALAALAARIGRKYYTNAADVYLFVASDGVTRCAITVDEHEVAYAKANSPDEAVRLAEQQAADT